MINQSSEKEIQSLRNYNQWPLNEYNGPSWLNCIVSNFMENSIGLISVYKTSDQIVTRHANKEDLY